MHGDKKWIRDYKGRLKKSKDRTYKDWLSDLACYDWAAERDEEKNCPECKVEAERIGRWVHPCTYDYETRRWAYDECRVVFYVPGYTRCEYHHWKYDVRDSNPHHFKDSYYHYYPHYWRNLHNRKERRAVKTILHRGRYDEDQYDNLSNKQMLRLGYWW